MFRRSFFHTYLFFLVLFLLVFPKGGIKIAEIPITWGYLLLGLCVLYYLVHPAKEVSTHRLMCLMLWLPFQLVSGISLTINGFSHLGYLFSFVLTFFIFPYCFYFLFSRPIDSVDLEFLFKVTKHAIFVVAVYGIVVFFTKLFFNFFIQIPFITVNYSDLGTLETTKSIDRGGIYKLISTYNNGNLYGVCLLMLTPLYYTLEPRLLKKNLLRFSFLLTLSRTVWIGLFIVELFYFLFLTKKSTKSLAAITSMIATALFVIYYLTSHTLDRSFFDFLFDYTLGGRLLEDKHDFSISFFSSHHFLNISEMVYLGIFENFGLVGLVTFLIGLFSPLIIWYSSKKTHVDLRFKAIGTGLISYWIIAISDGCILLIPTMVFYFFLSSFLLTYNKNRINQLIHSQYC